MKARWITQSVIAMLFVVATASGAEDLRRLIEQALDEPATISLERVKLSDAIRVIAEQTGIDLVISPATLALAPYGAETVVERVSIANVPVRQGLSELFSHLAMDWVVQSDHVEIVPTEGLRCLGRPPTWEELDTLAMLTSIRPGSDAADRATLRTRLRFEVPVRNGWVTLADALQNVGAGAGDEVLTVACKNLGWRWYPSGKVLVIASGQQMIQRALKQHISLRRNNRPLITILQHVGQAVGVTIRVEPGALETLPLHVRKNFSINIQSQSAEQVLEQIAAYTGLGYYLSPDSVVFTVAPSAVPPAPRRVPLPPDTRAVKTPGDGAGNASGSAGNLPAGDPSDPIVARMIVPLSDGQTVEWLIRRSELPADLRQLRQRDLESLFNSASSASSDAP